ncbi:MAG: HAD family phosphatase [Actinomycetota bacterium]|nr:HAD family phosphatase [Actinomycetota bacterium]
MPPPTAPHGLIVDWGGVLTERLDLAVRAWADKEGIDFEHYRRAMRRWFAPEEQLEAEVNPIHAIERGEMTVPDFEERLAAEIQRLDGHPVQADGLLERMFASFETAHAMNALVARAKRHGIRTALLSNSWGNRYPRDGWDDMFDVVVISGEVGMRKPEPGIFELTVGRLDVEGGSCVFVDDLEVNVTAAARLGMTGVLHRSYEQTATRLEGLFGLPLA